MTDHTSDMFADYGRAHKTPTVEYKIYFSLIFVAALPFALGGVVLSLLGLGGKRRSGGVLKRAWHEANAITPMIFMR